MKASKMNYDLVKSATVSLTGRCGGLHFFSVTFYPAVFDQSPGFKHLQQPERTRCGSWPGWLHDGGVLLPPCGCQEHTNNLESKCKTLGIPSSLTNAPHFHLLNSPLPVSGGQLQGQKGEILQKQTAFSGLVWINSSFILCSRFLDTVWTNSASQTHLGMA